jgi:hypothetical protein
MHIQAPTIPITHRAQIVSALAALAVAGGAYGAIAIVTNDDESTKSSQAPVVTKADSRVLDGSAILRGTANRVDTSRVLDGSPLLRGGTQAPTVVTVPHPRLDGGPFVTKSANKAQPSALQPPAGQPEGFHGH